MASSLSHLLLPKAPLILPSFPIRSCPRNSSNLLSFFPYTRPYLRRRNSLTKIPFALTESDSPKFLEPDSTTLLQELAVSIIFFPYLFNEFLFFIFYFLPAGVSKCCLFPCFCRRNSFYHLITFLGCPGIFALM